MNANSQRRTYYPAIEPYNQFRLAVGDGHELYLEESGNPKGKPVVFLHGGPGGGSEPKQRRFFDPSVYRIILFDQRGCGRSKPFASLENNTTWHLVADIEAIRTHLKIDRWQVFGGSWGSTLALAYAQTHPSRVTELVLRGIFLLRQWEIDWFYQQGTSRLFPDAWQAYLKPIPENERGDLVQAYFRRLTSDDVTIRREAARAWSQWEGRTSYLLQNESFVERMGADDFAAAFARIECHYFVNRGWLTEGRELLEKANLDKMRHIPGVIVQGRYDVVCPAESAFDLSRAWPEAKLHIVGDAGHSAHEPGNVDALVHATDSFRTRQ
jgi:proline iminopeptidase